MASDEPRLLHAFFERTAARHPDRTAVDIPPAPGRSERQTLSYGDLAAMAASVAAALADHVAGERIVAILLPRESLHLYAAQLGVLQAGGAWTCIDPAHPDEQVRAILEDCEPAAVLSAGEGLERCRALFPEPDGVLDVADILGQPSGSWPPETPWLSPSTAAYVIYTSGTTGRPKGVVVEHGSIANLVGSDIDRFGLTPDDRAVLASSPAYDSSIEETWLAFAVGATLVVLDDASARLGPDLVAWLRDERITVLCPPPTLLRTMGLDDPRVVLPDLRLVYVGGEPLPEDVATRWAPGRRLENGYGPTECTVTVLRAEILAGAPVTIGKPVRGNRALVLDEDLREVPDDEPGELCIAGPSLARGYLGLPDLTAERFPVHGSHGRIYRTGDLVHRDATGHYYFLGRIDAQVKLRGYRIELEGIEAALAGCPGVREAACRVQGEGSAEILAAHVVPADAGAPPVGSELQAALAKALPAHMVPGRFALTDRLPRLVSGKLDRAALPVLGAPGRDRVAPRDPLEQAVATAMRHALELDGDPSVEDDFFLDLGGTSLAAAVTVSVLRADAATEALTVRDVYAHRTASALAAKARGTPAFAEPAPEAARPRGKPLIATAVQGAWLAFEFLVGSVLLYVLSLVVLPWLLQWLGLVPLLLLGPLIGLAATAIYIPIGVWLAALAKRLLIGRYEPVRAPAWGSLHVRHWIVQHLARLVPWGFLSDTVFLNAVLRCLGARIGRRVHIHAGVNVGQGGWDLLDIGDDVALSQDASLRLVDLVDGEVVVGPVEIGRGAALGVRAGVSAHTTVGAGADLADHAWLPRGASVPPGARFEGIPATAAGPAPPAPEVSERGAVLSPAAHGLLTLLVRFGHGVFLYLLCFVSLAWLAVAGWAIDASQVVAWLFDPLASLAGLLGLIVITLIALLLSTALTALELRCLGRVRPGVISRWSTAYLRVLAKTDAVRSANRLLSGTLFWPVWLRWAGMRIGRNAEVSTIIDVVPELVDIGEETFLADGIYLGGARVRQNTVAVGATRLGQRTFLGNHVVVPAGSTLPDDILLGVCTVADDEAVQAGTSWFGHPAFLLPRHAEAELDRSLTHEPGALRILTRLLWESARFLLPVYPLLVLAAWLHAMARAGAPSWDVGFLLGAAPLVTFGAIALFVGFVVALKWLLLGRVRPGRHGLWSCWCSRWDFLYVVWGAYLRPILARLEGTLFLAVPLRAMGCRIGRRALLGGGFAQVVDPDMLRIADDATVSCLFQAHSFEDRVLKIGRVAIGPRASVGSGSVVFFGADIGSRTRVAPQSVVMKHEHLLPGRRYAGCPTAPADDRPQ